MQNATLDKIHDQPGQVAEETQRQYFRVTDDIPEQAWYWAALVSILISAALKLVGKDTWSVFIGQWPPTFLLFGLYHKLVQPSRTS